MLSWGLLGASKKASKDLSMMALWTQSHVRVLYVAPRIIILKFLYLDSLFEWNDVRILA